MIEEQLQFQKAIECIEEGNFGGAEVYLQQVLSKNIGHTGAMVSYIECLQQLERDAEALPLMAVLHSAHPENPIFTSSYVDALRDAERFGETIFPLRTCLQHIEPTAALVARLAQSYAQTNDTLNAHAFARWALALDPLDYRANTVLVTLLCAEDDFEEAIQILKKLVKNKPNDCRLRLKLGRLYVRHGQKKLAVQQFLDIVRQEPRNADLLCLIGQVYIDLRQYTLAQKYLRQAIQVMPDNSKALFYLGYLKRELGQFEQACDLFKQALVLDPHCALAHYNQALSVLSLGSFAEGFAEYHWRWHSMSHHKERLQLPLPTWNGVFVEDMHLFVWTEQGLGDGLFFMRGLLVLQCLAKRAGFTLHITFASDPRLRSVISHSLCDINIISYHDANIMNLLQGPAAPQFQIAVGDLFCLLWRDLQFDGVSQAYQKSQEQHLPLFQSFLYVEQEKKQAIIERHCEFFESKFNCKPQLRVGLSWHSNGDRCGGERSLALEAFLPMMKAHPEIQWVSLQYGDHQQEIEKCQAKLPPNCQLYVDEIIDPWHDIEGLMTLISGLDLVISIDNSTIHMSGSLGVPTWLLLGAVHNWRWPLKGDDVLWYPNMVIKRWGTLKVKDHVKVWEQQLTL